MKKSSNLPAFQPSSSPPRLFIGSHRPIYLWAGPGTIRMNRLKFMDAPVDEAVHLEAHTPVAARRVANKAGFNWAYLTYNWGFPPEVEAADWVSFRRAVDVYHAAGVRVFGYVQVSNCAFQGTFRDKAWYVRDPAGRPFLYYTGRYMTCWRDQTWRGHLRAIVHGIVDAGADGVFFDNPWHGAQPLHLFGAWMGPAGCYCSACRAAFRAATGLEIPATVSPESCEVSRAYLRWRAAEVTARLADLSAYARHLNPAIVISANDFDAVMRPSYLAYGIDLPALARVQDVVMIEDYGLPRWQPEHDGGILVNNALTLRTARALIGNTPLSTNPYDKGIGFDPVYAPHRFQRGIAEAAACGGSMVVKGTEYVDEGLFTLLTAQPYAPHRQAIGRLHHWLEAHADLYADRQNRAPVALQHPGDHLWQDWDRLAPLYFGAAQTLTAACVPWRVIPPDPVPAALQGLDALLTFDLTCRCERREAAPNDHRAGPPRLIPIPDLPGWAPPAPSFLARAPRLRALAARPLGWLFQGYFRWRWARRLVDRLGLVHFFWQTPYFRLPPAPARRTLLEALGPTAAPRVTATQPVLVELWEGAGSSQLHLVNYAPAPQPVAIDFSTPVAGTIHSPDDMDPGSPTRFHGTQLSQKLDVYVILVYGSE